METIIAQQLILFSFFASLTLLIMVGAIMLTSMARLARIQRLELAYSYANHQPALEPYTPPKPALPSNADTRPKRPAEFPINENKSVDIHIKPIDTTVSPSRYKPTATPNRTEKVG